MSAQLSTREDLLLACAEAQKKIQTSPEYQRWIDDLGKHIHMVQQASREEFFAPAFQRQLWNSAAVSEVGWGGSINVENVVTDQAIVASLWNLKTAPLPPKGSERTNYLSRAFNDCLTSIAPLVKKKPRQKLFNVFAALQPTEFITLSYTRLLRGLAKNMGLPSAAPRIHAVEVHQSILNKLQHTLGEVSPPPSRAGLERMVLPWALRTPNAADADTMESADADKSQTKLSPLPADRRRRGMLAIGGSFATVRAMVEFAKDGCMREDLREHIRSVNPVLSKAAINTNLNALIGEWGVLQANGDRLELTSRGEQLLENEDADEVSDWLLTKILGFDNLLHALKTRSALTRFELRSLLKEVNPGWTSNFAPDAMINWQRDLELIERKGEHFELTEKGQLWTERIHWTPGKLSVQGETEDDLQTDITGGTAIAVQRPPLQEILKAMPASAVFPPKLVARLDAGLWSNTRRHFAVLAGLSGSGKTLLARSYAQALWQGGSESRNYLYTLPVQPGWHDPSSVFGYVNPLDGDNYVRTGFLEFLLRASSDPARPYVAVLDEMNLSHPEQYLAPLLSAMETGDTIELHTFAEDVGGVPPGLPYPSNLLIIGTVNMDETTHGLSDKILDRAAVLEFWDVDIAAYPGWNSTRLSADFIKTVRTTLLDLYGTLYKTRLHFGWRTVSDIVGYLEQVVEGGVINATEGLDQAVFSKILPKLRGEDTKRLREALKQTHTILAQGDLAESAEKVLELLDDLQHTGSARFWR